MDTSVVIILVVVVLAIVAFVVMRSRSNAALSKGDAEPVALPPTQPAKPVARPAAETGPAAQVVAPTAPVQPTAPSNQKVAEQIPAPPPAESVAVAPSERPEVAPAGTLAPAVAAPEKKPAPVAKKDLSALRKGLQQTRGGWVQKLVGIFGGGKKEIDPELLNQIQEMMLMGDVGPKSTEHLTELLKQRLAGKDISSEQVIWSTLREVAHEVIDVKAEPFGAKAAGKGPLVVLVVGVNGVGKTTTIGKLAARYKEQGKKVQLAAGDTFRAAAVAQLEAWGKRVGVPVVKGKDLSKPSAVVFDAVAAGVKENVDVVIADTAGRLHTKTPLMDELRKLRDAASKALPGAPHEILLVLDATTGQNGLIQVKEFRDALDLTGIVLTKLDGTAKGGVILGICDEFKLPVRFVGVGEKVDDLREFDADDFTEALFSGGSDDDVAVA